MLSPVVFNTSEICFAHGVQHAVFSPGSRNAPLIISFARNDKIKKWIIPDERSAGFIALGIAQKLRQPVVLCCTSGTALLNYAPAVTEAFYREVPLIVLSADRPPELIDQRDGQTIRQFDVLKNHVKVCQQLPVVETEHHESQYREDLVRALSIAHSRPTGPVHVNIPFREPFYPSDGRPLNFTPIPGRKPETTDNHTIRFPGPESFAEKKILLLIGQSNGSTKLDSELSRLKSVIPILKSPLSNCKVESIEHVDFFLENQEALQPDILVTTGLSVLSKKLKNFLRSNTPQLHFHFDPSGTEIDTFGTNPKLIKAPLRLFLQELHADSISDKYLQTWKRFSTQTDDVLKEHITSVRFSETAAFAEVLKALPEDIDLHLGNSMPVRFAEMLGVNCNITTWCNRGTSGIDGCTSTAVGTALVSNRINLLLVGDVSFLYDRNAFFHNHSIANLRVIVFNNKGGGIFRLIDGPSRLPELEEYFETRHNRTAEYICAESNVTYRKAESLEGLKKEISGFYEDSKSPKLLEIFTDPSTNEHVFKELKQHIHEQINN